MEVLFGKSLINGSFSIAVSPRFWGKMMFSPINEPVKETAFHHDKPFSMM